MNLAEYGEAHYLFLYHKIPRPPAHLIPSDDVFNSLLIYFDCSKSFHSTHFF